MMQQVVRREPENERGDGAHAQRTSSSRAFLQGALGFVGLVLVCLGIGYVVLRRFSGTWEDVGGNAALQLFLPVWAMIFLSLVTPITIIAIRHQIRLTRVKLIDLFARSFGFDPKVLVPGQPDTPRDDANISFEFVKGKYYADLDLDGVNEPTLKDIPRFPMMLHADWMLLVCAVPFMVFSGFGMFILFAPVIEITQSNGWISAWLYPSVLAIGGVSAADIADVSKSTALHVNVLTIAALAFAGAYFYTLRLLLRAVATFDLSPVTFLRCFAHMVLSVTLAVVIYRVLPSGADILASAANILSPGGNITYADPRAGVSFIWLIIAFTLGFVPDTALQYVLQQASFAVKLRYDKVERQAKIIPLTIIDGIDHFTAFRLEEASIYDVQNLATFNPIMLHIESPYGIYQTIDWVAQAQLCTVVGPDRFILLKAFNIRTIFDLEHAMLASNADEGVQKEIARILTSDNARDKAMRSDFGFQPANGGDAYVAPALTVSGAQHMTRIIVDDLHVRRLRQICDHITRRLERDDWIGIDAADRSRAEMKSGKAARRAPA